MLRARRVALGVLFVVGMLTGCAPERSDDDDDIDAADAMLPPDGPPPVELCDNELDDDGDGDFDCVDADCATAEHCQPEMACDDGRDNDRDGDLDCADSDCAQAVTCRPEALCGDGADGDLDGDIDCADSDCLVFCAAGCTDADTLVALAATGLPRTVDTVDVAVAFPVTTVGWIRGAAVRFTVEHTFPADLDISLRAPAGGPTIDLTSDNGGNGQNYVDTVLTDSATSSITTGAPPFTGRYRPEEPFTTFVGRPAAGTWQLVFHDDFAGEVGTLVSADLYACVCDGTAGCERLQACRDGVDNDGDTLIDCADTADCGAVPQCTLETACSDRVDNNLDGLIDCQDPDCVGIAGCEQPEVTCTDGQDNDGDTLTDCDDANCTATAHCLPEADCRNGADDDGDGRADCLDVGCDGLQGCELGTEVTCTDGIDNDADGGADCADADCAGLFTCTACPVGAIATYRAATDLPQAIPSSTTVYSTIAVDRAGLIRRIAIKLDLTHTNDADLDLALETPGGEVELSTDNGGTGDNYTGTVFLDAAATAITAGTAPFTGAFRPEQPFDTLLGRPVLGNWRLRVTDDTAANTGVFLGYQLVVCHCDPATGDCELGAACRNGVDDDGDSVIDCAEASCATDPSCIPEAVCDDGLDQDLDGLVDCLDPHCDGVATCELGVELSCTDNHDNDADGNTDCLDADCAATPACQDELDCDNGLDDDGNGLIDCADANCVADLWCLPESDCADGLDNDADSATDCADLGCDGLQGCTRAGERACDDGLDNDGDGVADCADPECALWCAVPTCPAGSAKVFYQGTGLPIAIPDNDLANPATSVITTSAPGLISLAAVRLDIGHPSVTDLDIFLSTPNGVYELSSDNGSTGDNYLGTIFVDSAPGRIGTTGFTTAPFTGPYGSEWPLAGLVGVPTAGRWTLQVADDLASNAGELLNYQLLFCQCDAASGDCESGPFACRNGVDDDGDALVDCAEPACAGDRSCAPPPAAEVVCNDGLDDDGDSAIDCADPDCGWVCATLGATCTGGRQLVRAGAIDLPQPISATALTHLNAPFRVARTGTVFRAAVRFNALHTSADDLTLYLGSPEGTILELTSGNGSTGDNYVDTVFVDTAVATIGSTGFNTAPFTGRYRPEQPLSLLAFENPLGLWWAQLRDVSATTDGGGWTELSLGLCLIP